MAHKKLQTARKKSIIIYMKEYMTFALDALQSASATPSVKQTSENVLRQNQCYMNEAELHRAKLVLDSRKRIRSTMRDHRHNGK